MIQRTFSLTKPYRVAIYARMSDKKQNQRSPEQQVATAREVMRRLNCPWTVVQVYADRGIKARFRRRREGLQQLLRDIEAGLIKVDLIVVDCYERFGRSDEFEEVRRKLRDNHGVLIVSSDNSFADPTGIVGKAVGLMEQFRSTEEGRVKAHQVIRGKKDALRQKHWPGGPVPFGYRLKKRVDPSGPEPPQTGPIIQGIFEKAHETGWGGTRLAAFFNADPSVPLEHKPLYSSTIGMWLGSEIYIGVGVWGELCTDIINDARVIEPNPRPDEIVRVAGFCEALVSEEVFYAIKAVRDARKRPKAQAVAGDQKLIEPVSPGLSIKHPLAGMVGCGQCGACSVPRSSGRKSKAGQEYCYYTCPRHNDGACDNAHHVRVDRLVPAVFGILRKRLLPPTAGAVPAWFGDVVRRVEAYVRRSVEEQPRQLQQTRSRITELENQMSGWRQSLGNPQLTGSLRQDLERDYEAAKDEKLRLESELASDQALQRQAREMLDPRKVAEALQRLGQILAAENPCLINLELARHIERVECFRNGRVVLRGTWLGAFEGAVELLSRGGAGENRARATPDGNAPGTGPDTLAVPGALPAVPTLAKVRPRRLARRRVDDLSDQAIVEPADADRALDPHRFAGLEDCFMWEEPLVLERTLCWAEAHAGAVSARRGEDPKSWTLVKLAAHFGVSVPTVRKALRIAAEQETVADPRGRVPAEGDDDQAGRAVA